MARSEPVPGVHRFDDGYVNWYLDETPDGPVLIDAGFPGDFDAFQQELGETGHALADLRAVLITHAHIDHLGFADRVRQDAGVPVHVPQGDAELARSPLKAAKSERNPLAYVAREGATRSLYLGALRKLAIRAKYLGEFETYGPGDALPGGLRAIACPGHTFGHSAILDASRSVLFAGDAFVTRDPYTGRTGPRIVARAATADAAMAMRSLTALEETGAQTVLTGHGEPWTDGVSRAVTLARSNPVA
ncbi:MAG TPA: MBL fold metallo-hydrolase [Capillimicrobium sp.]|jgi:glyoxylase-like metal-dependent hydrolase (beta-lactamase superfamily II)